MGRLACGVGRGADLVVVAGLLQRSLAMCRSIIGTWLPLALIFVATLATGELMSTLPWKKPIARTDAHAYGPLSLT